MEKNDNQNDDTRRSLGYFFTLLGQSASSERCHQLLRQPYPPGNNTQPPQRKQKKSGA